MRILATSTAINKLTTEFDAAAEKFKSTAKELETVMEEIKNGVIEGPIAKSIYDVYEPQKDAFAQTIRTADEVMEYLNMQNAGLVNTVDESTSTITSSQNNVG